MPEPRPLSNISRVVIKQILRLLENQQDEFYEVVVLFHRGDVVGAVEMLKGMAARNNVAQRALVLLLANKQQDAEEEVIRYREGHDE